MRVEDVKPTDVVEVVVHGAFLPRLVEWAKSQSFVVVPSPFTETEPDALPCFFIQRVFPQ